MADKKKTCIPWSSLLYIKQLYQFQEYEWSIENNVPQIVSNSWHLR